MSYIDNLQNFTDELKPTKILNYNILASLCQGNKACQQETL